MAEQDGLSALGKSQWAEIDAIPDIGIIPEDVLHEINRKGSLRKFVLNCSDDQ